jgi:hypothetical protein
MGIDIGGEDLTTFLQTNLHSERMDFEDFEMVIF